MTRWSIGDLAKASGLTVRTVHHHDKIGLITASERTLSGHRRYTPDEVRRLYQVRSLCRLVLCLEEVRLALSHSDSRLTAEVLLPAYSIARHRRVR
ncbi:hypothetical protein GCM10011609_36550 [Lentzea pudingi]|uniref:HTH merR-type domain-containing protein n=1 Tax=Lentzea pudingi TaxID=1789439 RepID=A0ABQ2HZV5_9PSEU|nr:MerR family DNA-binding transcriptional regulator [Lentzea pudingi]GGM95634.1 hypothetical protein GCM10011609_36550 [Lentzea pudingi]